MSSTLLNKDPSNEFGGIVVSTLSNVTRKRRYLAERLSKTSQSYECSNTNGDAVAPAPSNVTRALAERPSNTRSKLAHQQSYWKQGIINNLKLISCANAICQDECFGRKGVVNVKSITYCSTKLEIRKERHLLPGLGHQHLQYCDNWYICC